MLIAEQAATELLLRQRPYGLIADVAGLRVRGDIHFSTMQHYCATTSTTLSALMDGASRDGLTLRRVTGGGVVFLVLYNREAPWGRRNFTLAHELGHIYLGHRTDDEQREREANRFACQLLLPRVLVRAYVGRQGGLSTAADVAEVFGASREAAANRLRDLDDGTEETDRDRELLRRFGPLLTNVEGPVVDW